MVPQTSQKLPQPGLIRWAAGQALAFLLLAAVLLMPVQANPARAQDSQPTTAGQTQSSENPEAATGTVNKSETKAGRQMISAANPYAVAAGLEMLREGGSAIDAAIAVQMVLNLVEPQSSGIGGGAFLVHWDAANSRLTTYDGRESAPASARPERFLKADGTRMNFSAAVKTGLSVGVPGLLAVLDDAHKKHGKLPWSRLFAPAIRLAEDGFEVSNRLSFLLGWKGSDAFDTEARNYFFKAGQIPQLPGTKLKNPALATTFRKLASNGSAAFYSGELAEAIVAKVADGHGVPGGMTLADLAGYRAIERAPVCVDYRRHKICGMGPPSSGMLTVGQILKLIEPYDLGVESLNIEALHLIAEAGKLAYADRDRYMADADFVPVPAGLLDAGYLAGRSRLIKPDVVIEKALPGQPPGLGKNGFGRDGTIENKGTSQISIVDAQGNALSMTTTIEGAFGSGLMVGGFLLNNEMTDFSFTPLDADGEPVANRVEAGKRPRSSMAPTIIFDAQGEVKAVLGSPGGSRIILYVVKAIVAMIDWKLGPQQAAALANFGSTGGPFQIEIGTAAFRIGVGMKRKGHSVKPTLMTSGLHIVMRDGNRLVGGADPRREGVARGE